MTWPKHSKFFELSWSFKLNIRLKRVEVEYECNEKKVYLKRMKKNVKTCSRWKWSSPSQLSVESQPVLQEKIVSIFFHFLFYVQKKIVSLCGFLSYLQNVVGKCTIALCPKVNRSCVMKDFRMSPFAFFMCANFLLFFGKVFVTTSSCFSLTKNSDFQQKNS